MRGLTRTRQFTVGEHSWAFHGNIWNNVTTSQVNEAFCGTSPD